MAATMKVFKKTTSNDQMTLYLAQREFYDCLDFCQSINGVVVVDDEYLNGRAVYCQLIVNYQYGRDEDEVLGIKFAKDFLLYFEQIYPAEVDPASLTTMQSKTMQKHGEKAHPFMLHFPKNAPNSVILQDDEPDSRQKPLGVSYLLKIFIGEEEDADHQLNLIDCQLIKLQNVPASIETRYPVAMVTKEFTFTPGQIDMKVTLDREIFYHWEKVPVTVYINNESTKTVRSIKCNIIQQVELTMINEKFTKEVASLETREGCPIESGNELTKSLFLVPSAQNTASRKGIALDGYLKSGDIHLASTTLAAPGKEVEKIGIVVSYTVYVELDCGTFGGVVVAEVPLKLINPTPGSIASERALASKKMQSLEERRQRNSLFESDNNLVYRGRRPSVYEPDE